jgi:hypothetical protein
MLWKMLRGSVGNEKSSERFLFKLQVGSKNRRVRNLVATLSGVRNPQSGELGAVFFRAGHFVRIRSTHVGV